MSKNSSKTEQKGISVLRNILDKMERVTYSLEEGDKNISWDGDIKLYKNSDIDDKSNLDSIIRVQVKGRTRKIPNSDKMSFFIDRADLQNYLLENGTMYFVIIFNKNNDFKIFYIDLLPYNIRKLLQEDVNGKNEVKVKLKQMPIDPIVLEKVLRNFASDMKQQKRISDKVFEQENMTLSVDGKKSKIEFYSWGSRNDIILSLVGEEKYFYELDENDNVINVELATLTMISEPFNIKIKDKKGNVYFDKVDCVYTKDKEIIKIGKSFNMHFNDNKFNVKIVGTLKERVHSLKFLNQIKNDGGFFINDKWLQFKKQIKETMPFETELEIYTKILSFTQTHNIDKDIDLDQWNWEEINKFTTWIRAIDDGIPIKVDGFKTSVIGSITIKDICFSIFAERKDDGKIFVKSIWDSNINDKYIFMRGNPEDNDRFETRNIFDFLNKQAYLSDDIDYIEMKNYYNNNEVKEKEEISINMQALEAILAYDIKKDKKILEYAEFLLNKIINIESISDVAFINKCQIKKRLNTLTLDDKYKLIKILEKEKEYQAYNISINLLIDKKEEAKIEFNNLTEYEKEQYLKFPISIFLESK